LIVIVSIIADFAIAGAIAVLSSSLLLLSRMFYISDIAGVLAVCTALFSE
jgi:hypothetical protein